MDNLRDLTNFERINLFCVLWLNPRVTLDYANSSRLFSVKCMHMAIMPFHFFRSNLVFIGMRECGAASH